MSQNKHFALCSLPLFGAFLACALASAQNYRPAYQHSAPAAPAPVIRTQSTAIRPPKRPAPLPKPSPAVPAVAPSLLSSPPEPAKVSLASGKLKVEANNSTLSQILQQIAKAGGMKIDGLRTSGNANPRVFGSYGPGAPLDVLSDLLNGAGYNVLMMGNTPAGTPREMALSLRGSAGIPRPAPRPPAAAQNVESQGDVQPAEDTTDAGDTDETPPSDSSAEPENGQVPPEGVQENQPITTPPPPGEGQKVKTPQEILQELQNMRLQQQQQQQ
ncbi:MAG: hypothetical protein ACRD3F_16590 [Acidobacteriaceae bacterium]